MNNLHKISPTIELTDPEIAILYYIQDGNEPDRWEFTIGPDGRLWARHRYDHQSGFEPVKNQWNMNLAQHWYDAGKPAIDMSILKPYKA